MPSTEPYIEVTLGGLERDVSDINTLLRHSGRLEIPREFPSEGIARAQVDAEILAQKLRENPEEMRQLVDAVIGGRGPEVQRLMSELAVAESDFQAAGGGIFWAIVIVGVLCCAGAAY
jgi:hypothetical protein